MRQLWLRWGLLTVFVVVLAVAFISLGRWQLDRLEQRQARNAVTEANLAAPVRPYDQVSGRPVTEADQWQRVSVRGTFDGRNQFVVRYRGGGGEKGYQVVTPLDTGGSVVLVDRGLVPLPAGTAIPATAPAPPSGAVTVVGYLRRSEVGRPGAVQPSNGQVRLINSEALGAALGRPVADGYLSALRVEPAQAGGFRPVSPPDLTEGPHFWYAVQWFLFTGIGVLGVVVFVRGDLRERREAEHREGARR